MLVRCLWSIIRFMIVVGLSVVIWMLYLANMLSAASLVKYSISSCKLIWKSVETYTFNIIGQLECQAKEYVPVVSVFTAHVEIVRLNDFMVCFCSLGVMLGMP